MSAYGHLPSGGEALPRDERHSSPLLPIHKAIILYFMYFAEEASGQPKEDEVDESYALRSYGHFYASGWLKRVYGVDIDAQSIRRYYIAVKSSAKDIVPWSHFAAIVSIQLQHEGEVYEVTSFLAKVNEVSHPQGFFLPCVC